MALDLETHKGEERAILDALKDLRKKKGMSQREVAELMGMAQGNYNRLENGKYTPRLSTIILWARVLGHKIELTFDSEAFDEELQRVLHG